MNRSAPPAIRRFYLFENRGLRRATPPEVVAQMLALANPTRNDVL